MGDDVFYSGIMFENVPGYDEAEMEHLPSKPLKIADAVKKYLIEKGLASWYKGL